MVEGGESVLDRLAGRPHVDKVLGGQHVPGRCKTPQKGEAKSMFVLKRTDDK